MGNKNSKHNVIFIDIDGVLNYLEFHNRDRSKKKLFDRECVKRLAEIVDILESGDEGLEKTILLYQEGNDIVDKCEKELENAKLKLTIISEDKGATL